MQKVNCPVEFKTEKTHSKMCHSKFIISIISLIVGVMIGGLTYRIHVLTILNNSSSEVLGIPDSIGIQIDSTNLPIVFINTKRRQISREYITAEMTIIDNGVGRINYGDTIAFPKQENDYHGLISIKYRGNSSYSFSNKKSFTICTLVDTSSADGRVKKKKSSLLGMRKGKKWALKANHFDKSMMKDVLTFELARPYMDFVPQARYCEVIVNGIYYGVYTLMETVSASRLKIGKPNEKKNDYSGGYLLQLDRRRDTVGAYFSRYWPRLVYKFESPKVEELTFHQKDYICNKIDQLESAFAYGSFSDISKLMDISSMIDYQLSTEFAQNGDGYDMSTFVYKRSNESDSLYRFVLWDYDLAYLSPSQTKRFQVWVYPDKQRYDSTHIDFWWMRMMKDSAYENYLCSRWLQYRQEAYTNEHIHQLIDSIVKVLTTHQAVHRNGKAWPKLWGHDWWGPHDRWPENVISQDYDEEVEILKEWINRRLDWMDKKLRINAGTPN